MPVGRVRRERKLLVFLASLPSLALCFQPKLHTFCLTARAYLNTQKYGLLCSLTTQWTGLIIFVVVFLSHCYNEFADEWMTSSRKISSTALASPFSVKKFLLQSNILLSFLSCVLIFLSFDWWIPRLKLYLRTLKWPKTTPSLYCFP